MNHRETLYSSKGKIVYVVGKPCNIYKLRGKPYTANAYRQTTDKLMFKNVISTVR